MKCVICKKENKYFDSKGICMRCHFENLNNINKSIYRLEKTKLQKPEVLLPRAVETEKPNNVTKFKKITVQMANMYEAKNNDYGNSFSDMFNEFGLTSSIIRLSDKLNRLKSLNTKEAMVKDESIIDTLMDLANYSIMTIVELENKGE